MSVAFAQRTVNVPAFDVRAAFQSVNKEARTVELVWSTGAAVPRYDYFTGKRYTEILSMKPGHVRLERLNAGASLLDTHSDYSLSNVLGSVQPGTARLEKGQGIAVVRFSKRAEVEPFWQDVVDGIIKFSSVKYRVHKFEETAIDNQIPVRTAIDWEPFEISMVPVPADAGVKLRAAEDTTGTNPCVIVFPTVADADRLRRFRLACARH